MPAGSGVQLPAGGEADRRDRLSRQHGRRRRARVSLGLYFAEKPPAQTPSSIEIAPPPLSVARRQERRAHARRNDDQVGDDDRGDVAAARTRREVARAHGDSPGRQRRADVVGEQLPAEWPAPYILKEPIVAARGNAAGDDGLLRQHDGRGARREAVARDYCAAVVSPGRNTRTVNGIVDSTLLRWNCSQMR